MQTASCTALNDAATLAKTSTKLANESLKVANTALTLTSAAAQGAADAAAAKAKMAKTGSSDPDCNCSGTTVFLVGNHFSVVDTKIIAGGLCIPRDAFRLLSRQVLEVTIPWNVATVTIDGDTWVDVQIATPYGVTGYLHIPAYNADPPAKTDTTTSVATAASPLMVQLDKNRGMTIDFNYNNKINTTTFKLDPKAPESFTISYLDPDVPAMQSGQLMAVNMILYNGTKSLGAAVIDGAATFNSKGKLTIKTADVLKACQGIMKGSGAQSFENTFDPSQDQFTLSGHFYLEPQHQDTTFIPSPLHVINLLSITSAQGPTPAKQPTPANPMPPANSAGDQACGGHVRSPGCVATAGDIDRDRMA